jgi:hypothetical protein
MAGEVQAIGPDKSGKSGPGPAPRRNIVSIRGAEAWRAWLMALAAHRRLKASDVIDQALTEYAQKYGYPERVPPR